MNALLEAWTGFVLRSPALLLAALLVPVVLLLRRRAGDPAVRFSPAPLEDVRRETFVSDPNVSPPRRGHGGETFGSDTNVSRTLPRTWRTRLLPLPRALATAGLLLAVFALARPAERVAEPVPSEGVDVMLCLDTSSSMTAADLVAGRTRLEVAREAAARFVKRRESDRVGLVAFARYPELRCPPTLDHDALAAILLETAPVPGDGPEDATGIGAAVARGAQVLSGGTARSRVLILLTDGEENVATVGAEGEIAPAHAAQLCERLKVRVYAIVVGAAPGSGGGGEVERLARRTGGAFHEARDAGALEAVYARIDALERSPVAASVVRLEDRHLPLLLAAIALLVAARFLSATALRVSP